MIGGQTLLRSCRFYDDPARCDPGFGRIGRNVMRVGSAVALIPEFEIVGVNATSDPKTSAHLLTYDSILGQA